MPHRPDHPFAGTAAEPALQGSSSDADPDPGGTDVRSPMTAVGGHEPAHGIDAGLPDATAADPGDEAPAAPGYADVWPEPAPSPRPLGRTVRVAVLTGLVVLVLGAPLGLLWHWLAPTVPVLDAGSSGIVVNDPSPEEYVAADGWYTMLALGFGLLVAIAAWLILRRDRGPFLLLAVVVGTLGAGYLVGPWVGGLIGRSGYHHWQETAVQGATYHAPPQVHSVGPRLVAAFAAAIVLTLMAGWSNDPDLDAPGAKPGYDANTRPATGA